MTAAQDQAVPDLERTIAALREQLDEYRTERDEALVREAALAEVLNVINRSAGDLRPVFEVILEKAIRLSGSSFGYLLTYDGELLHTAAMRGLAPGLAEFTRKPFRPTPGMGIARVVDGEDVVQIADVTADAEYKSGNPMRRAFADQGGARTALWVALRRDDTLLGVFVIFRKEVRSFFERQIELVRNFATQAVIAMENARLLGELQARTGELTSSVAELQALEAVLRAVNASLDLETVLATIIDRAVSLVQADEGMIYEFDTAEQVFVPKAAVGMTEQRIARLRERRIRIGETYLGRSASARMPIHIEDVQQDPSTPEAKDLLPGIHAALVVPLLHDDSVVGGLVVRRRREGAFTPATLTLMQTFAAQCVLAIGNARLFDAAHRARATAEVALADLHRAQDRLVQSEKMASLGQLTAGIAHEIKNPLNFVNNFSLLSAELIDELLEVLAPEPLNEIVRAEVDDLTALLKGNLEKVVQHGKRADGIVKNMLLHSRESGGEMRSVDLNATVEEALNLAYHGARAEKPGFNITLVRNYDPRAGSIDLHPQEFTRVMLNLITNGFYAAAGRKTDTGDAAFEPTLSVTTEARPREVAIRIRDNGTGIPDTVRAKMFEPFFTTKPAGEGTGLGLSLSHDIVVKQHGGSISVDSRVGEFAEFTVTLPRTGAGAPP